MIEIIMELLRKVNKTAISVLVMHLKNSQSECHRDTCPDVHQHIWYDFIFLKDTVSLLLSLLS